MAGLIEIFGVRDADEFDDYVLCRNTVLKEYIKPKFKNWALDQFEDSIWC